MRDLALALRDEERFGVCLDVAHIMLSKVKPERWFWELVIKLISENELWKSSILLEMKGMDKIQKSLDFINRYVGE